MQIEIALAISPKLLVGDQECLVDRVAMGQLIDVATGHAANRLGERSTEQVTDTVTGEGTIVRASSLRGQGKLSSLGRFAAP